MKKSFIIVIVIALGTVGVLYSLPKVVVSDEKKNLEQSAETTGQTANRDAGLKKQENPSAEEMHAASLTPEQKKAIDGLKSRFLQSTDSQSKIKAAENLIKQFVSYTKYDSAAHYAEAIVKIDPSEYHLVQAGNLYYEAFTYSLNDQKGAKMGEKAREYYQKALTVNPNNLLVKTNMAMTYVSTTTPMQGIALLREVIGQDPDNIPALFNLGILAIRSNQFGKGVDRFKQILKIDPANTKAALNLGYCFAELDRKDEARKILEKVVQNTKDPLEKSAANEILEKLK